MNNWKKPIGDGQRGSIAVLFCLLIVIVVGTVSYSLYMGHNVEQKISNYNGIDAGALATGGHVSQGLNMISANNLTIGAALHVSASVPILAAYASLVYAFTTSIDDVLEEAVSIWVSKLTARMVTILNRYQENVWNNLAVVTGFFIRIAAGLTGFNKFLTDWWLIAAPLRGIEMARMNSPDLLTLPFQSSMFDGDTSFLGYGGVEIAPTKETFCHALKTSEGIAGREEFWNWLAGPLLTFADDPGNFTDTFKKTSEFADRYIPMKLTFVDCGYGLKSGILQFLQSLAKGLSMDIGENNVANVVSRTWLSGQGAIVVKNIASNHAEPSSRRCELIKGLVKFEGYVKAIGNTFNDELADAFIYYKSVKGWKEDVESHPRKPSRGQFNCRLRWQQGWQSGPGWNKNYERQYTKYYSTQSACEVNEEANFQNAMVIWKEHRSPYSCETDDGTLLWDQVPHPKPGTVKCLDLRNMDPECTLKKFVKMPKVTTGSCKNEVRDNLNKWKNGCDDFYEEDRPDDMVQIVDWGEQIDTYVSGGSMSFWGQSFEWNGRDTADQLGFSYIADQDAFAASTYFVLVGANAGRIEQQACPEALKVVEDEKEYCAVPAMKGLAEFYTGADRDQLTVKQKREQMRHISAGAEELWLAESGALAGSWERAQWVIAGSKVYKKSPRADEKLDLFWPDWQPRRNRPVREFFQNIVKKFGTEDQANDLGRLYR